MINQLHDCRAADLWLFPHAPLQSVSEDESERFCRRTSLAASGGSDFFLALAINHPCRATATSSPLAAASASQSSTTLLPNPACKLHTDKYGKYPLSDCATSANSRVVSRHTRPNDDRDYINHPVAANAQLSLRIEPKGLFPDTHGQANCNRPASVFVETPLACRKTGADKTSIAIDVTVVKADTVPLAVAGRSTATRAEGKQRRDFLERVADVNAALKT